MEQHNTYENIHFSNMINVIEAESFPRIFPLHWHKYVEIAALAEDAAVNTPPSIRIGHALYQLDPGDILLIWPGEVHETVENRDGRLTGIQFPATMLSELPDFAPFFNIFRTFHHIRQAQTPGLAQQMLSHIRQMLSVQDGHGTFAGVETVICLYEMFMDFGLYIKNSLLSGKELHPPGSSGTIEKISAACSYIVDHCDQEITLESVAGLAGFSEWYFSRIFKQITNYNFVEYVTLQRIKRAQLMLSDSDTPITEISYQAGFKSISTFNRVFRQYRGCSPSEYRKYYLK